MFPNLVSLRFLAASLALHAGLLLLARAQPLRPQSPFDRIPVTILEPAEPAPPQPAPRVSKAPFGRAPRAPTKVAPKESQRDLHRSQAARSSLPPQAEVSEKPEPRLSSPQPAPAREIVPEQTIVAERPLPSMRDLLPSANFASRGGGSAPVSLNTSDPVYVSYFTKIKQLIEAHWQYPELALRYGLQGKLSLEFTVGSLGQLERARILRSSGSQLLDDEALRAIQAAAPFPPIPSWIKPNPLSIVAAMEYHDNRVHYQFAR